MLVKTSAILLGIFAGTGLWRLNLAFSRLGRGVTCGLCKALKGLDF